MIRWKGVITLAVITGLFIALSMFLTDKWVEKKLEDLGSSIIGAKVEIDNLNISLSQMMISWSRLQVTHPQHTMKNMFETGKSEFNLEFWPLLSKKVIIEDFRIAGFRTFTDRETDGALPEEEQKEEESFIGKKTKEVSNKISQDISTNLNSLKSNVNTDSILKILDIRSVKKIDSLKTRLNDQYASWNARLKEMSIEKDAKDVEQRIKKINIKNIKSVSQLQETISNINTIKKKIEKSYNDVSEAKKDLTTDIKTAKEQLLLVDDWIAEDYQRAYSMAKIPDLSVKNIAKLLFGESLMNKLNQYLYYFNKAREYSSKIKSDKPEKTEPPRLKGQDIYFYSKNARPDFWIKRTDISGVTNEGLKLAGTIDNIVSDQRFINKPTTFDFKGGNPKGGIKASLNGKLNYLEDQPHETMDLKYAGFSLADTRLSASNLFPTKLGKGVGDVQAKIDLPGDHIEGIIKFTARNISFDFSQQHTQNKITQLIRDAIKDVKTFYFSAKLSGEKNNIKVSIKSNLDKIIVENLKKSVDKEIEKTKKQISERIDKEVSDRKAELEKLVKQYEDKLNVELAKYQAMLDKEKAKADKKKKEVEDRINKEKSKLQDKVKDKLKGLF